MAEEEEGLNVYHSETLEATQPFIRHSQRSQGSRHGGPSDKHKVLSPLNALALVVGLQVGSGIFASPSQISRNVPGPGIAVLVWLVAGILVWTGAATLVELGLQMPENGGIQEYLRCCYGDYMGCVFSWAWVWISKASSLAIITGVFADYLHRAFYPDTPPPWLAAKLVGMLGLWLITVLNWSGPKAGATMANGLFVLKVMLLASILLAGLQLQLAGKTEGSPASKLGWFGRDPTDDSLSGFAQTARFVAAMFGALFSYNGWESIGFILGNMTDRERNLPRVLHSALAIVVTGFVSVNACLYVVVPFHEVRESNTPFINFASRAWGSVGTSIFSVAVAISALGALNANLFSNASLSVAASLRGYFPAAFSNMHCSSPAEEQMMLERKTGRVPRLIKVPILGFTRWTARNRWEQNVPIFAMSAQALCGSALFLLGSLDQLIKFAGISQYLFLFLAALGVFILRRRAREAGTTPGYRAATWNPIIFCVLTLSVVVDGVLSAPQLGFVLGFMIAISWAVFRYWPSVVREPGRVHELSLTEAL